MRDSVEIEGSASWPSITMSNPLWRFYKSALKICSLTVISFATEELETGLRSPMRIRLSVKSITLCHLNSTQIITNIFGPLLVSVTKELNDVLGVSQVDFWMDSAKGVGHRVIHGHSLDNVPVIIDKFGWQGLFDYFSHGMRDTMSPHGMPVPFAKEISIALGLSPLQAVEWLSFNIGELISVGFSIVHSARLFATIRAAVESGHVDQKTGFSALLGAVVKLGIGMTTINPLTIGVGIVDLGIIAWGTFSTHHRTKITLYSSELSFTNPVSENVQPMSKTSDHAILDAMTSRLGRSKLFVSEAMTRTESVAKLKTLSLADAFGSCTNSIAAALSTHSDARKSAQNELKIDGKIAVGEAGLTKDAERILILNQFNGASFLPNFLHEAYCD